MHVAQSGAAEGPSSAPPRSLCKQARTTLLNVHPQPGIEWPGAWASSAHTES